MLKIFDMLYNTLSYWLGGSSERLHLSVRHPDITGRL